MQRMLEGEHVADCIRGRETDSGRPDDARIEQCDCEECGGPVPDVFGYAGRYGVGILESAKFFVAGEGRGRERHHRDGADQDENDPDDEIKAFVVDETRRDAFVNHVALLEEKLPRGDRRADDSGSLPFGKPGTTKSCTVWPRGA